MKTTTIDFVDNATTKEAGIYAVRYGWAFVKDMTEERFYCERPRCSVHNKKTQDLAYNLKAFRNAEFVFSEKFTPVMLFEVLKSVVAELNSEYRGREIKVEMTRFIDTISYTFKDDPNSDACLGGLRLTPIKTVFNSVKDI